MLLNNLNSSNGKDAVLLSVDDIRNAARALGDISSLHQTSGGGHINFLNMANSMQQESVLAPIKLDFTNEYGDDQAQGFAPYEEGNQAPEPPTGGAG